MKNAINKEVKEEILEKIKAGEKVSILSSHYGVSAKTMYNWLRGKAVNTVSFMEYSKLKKENQVLKEIVGVLTVELEKTKRKSRSLHHYS
ncbi:MAG: transposase [Patescibacteria group bacterium]|nr:transposase [Patescibacteria group bacterium]